MQANPHAKERPAEPTREQAYQRRIAELQAENADLKALVAELRAQVARLSEQIAKLSKNSSNSSKPPSSDIVKPSRLASGKKTNSKKTKRKIGGQPGHAKHERPPFSPEEIDDVREYRLDCCPDCGGAVSARPTETRVVQQVELLERPIEIVEHRAEGCWCRRCRKVVYAPLPAVVQKGGLVGAELTALVGYLKGVCHASFSTIRKYFRDVLEIPISRGQLAKVVGKVSMAMGPAYEELRARLPRESRLNVDETGHKDKGKPHWTWCFRAPLYTLFKIDPSRGSAVLIDLPDKRTQVYGERLLDSLRELFGFIHRRETMTPRGFERALAKARTDVINAATWAPRRQQAQNLANRFHRHGDAYFRFLTTPGVEPTNHLAEQAIRFVVIDRRITQGTRSERGQRWCERIWSAIATCTRQGRSVFEYLREAVCAHFNDQPIPSLIPAGP